MLETTHVQRQEPGPPSRHDDSTTPARSLTNPLRAMSFAEGEAALHPQNDVKHSHAGPQIQMSGKGSPTNRGRLQIQGGGLELSWPWATNANVPATDATAGLDALWGQLSKREKATRNEAYANCRNFIESCPPNGQHAPLSETFQNRNLSRSERDHRVDIEVIKGVAFV